MDKHGFYRVNASREMVYYRGRYWHDAEWRVIRKTKTETPQTPLEGPSNSDHGLKTGKGPRPENG